MRLWLKMLMVLGLTLAILVPLAMVRGVIGERERYRADAVASVERSFAGPQAIAGPVLTVPYVETVQVDQADRDGVMRTVRRRQAGAWTFFPTTVTVTGPLMPTLRRRGIYEVRLYDWHGAVSARFDARIPAAVAGSDRVILEPWLSFGIADVRGIRSTPRLQVDGRDIELREGFGAREANGLHVRLAVPEAGTRLQLATRLVLDLSGAESFGVVPLGKFNRIDIASPWPHPSFQGISPFSSRIDAAGFKAQWRVASVATDVQRQYLGGRMAQPLDDGVRRDPSTPTTAAAGLEALGIVLTDPVDAYTQADRATKYGVLFVLLTFVGFFMFEVLRALPIHPIQYGLVGLALAVFFLLLVSLSEHLRFGWAYVVASGACVGLIGFYLSAVLRSAARGAGFAAMLGLLYGALYGLLVSEDNALVLGASLLFATLAGVMLATRRLDWSRVGSTPPVRAE